MGGTSCGVNTWQREAADDPGGTQAHPPRPPSSKARSTSSAHLYQFVPGRDPEHRNGVVHGRSQLSGAVVGKSRRGRPDQHG